MKGMKDNWEKELFEVVKVFKQAVLGEKPLSIDNDQQASVAYQQLKSFIRANFISKDHLREIFREAKYRGNVDDYLKLVKEWDGKNFDVPFDDGFNAALNDLKTKLDL